MSVRRLTTMRECEERMTRISVFPERLGPLTKIGPGPLDVVDHTATRAPRGRCPCSFAGARVEAEQCGEMFGLRRGPELGHDSAPSGGAHLRGPRRIAEQLDDGARQGRGVAGRDEEARLAVDHHLPGSAHRGRDDRQCAGHGLDQGDRQPLPQATGERTNRSPRAGRARRAGCRESARDRVSPAASTCMRIVVRELALTDEQYVKPRHSGRRSDSSAAISTVCPFWRLNVPTIVMT